MEELVTWQVMNLLLISFFRICVLSLLDLPFIVDPKQQELIANKFISAVDPFVVPCLQEILRTENKRMENF